MGEREPRESLGLRVPRIRSARSKRVPNGTAAKTELNESISDAGRGVSLGILAHKAESAGRVVVPVNPHNTSRPCLDRGRIARENRLTQDRFRCVECSFTEHADVVGATNILRAGPALHDTAQVSWEARRSSGGWSHLHPLGPRSDFRDSRVPPPWTERIPTAFQ